MAKFSTVGAFAPVIPTSSFRDMQGIGIIPSISSGASPTIVQNNQLL